MSRYSHNSPRGAQVEIAGELNLVVFQSVVDQIDAMRIPLDCRLDVSGFLFDVFGLLFEGFGGLQRRAAAS